MWKKFFEKIVKKRNLEVKNTIIYLDGK